MNKTLLLTMLAAPLLFTSCGEKEQEGSAESSVEMSSSQANFEELAEQELKSRITKFTTDLMLDTPSYLKLEGPTISHSYNEAAGTLFTELVWTWSSSKDFYTIDSELTTKDKLIQVVDLKSPKGKVAKHTAKAVCNVDAELEELSFVRLFSTPDSFVLNDSSVSELGQPLSSFRNVVISGSSEHIAAVQEYKAYTDKKASEEKAAAQKEAEEKALARQKSIDSLLATLKKEGDFTGVLENNNKKRGAVKFSKASIRETAGEVVVSFQVWAISEQGEIKSYYKPAAFEGSFDGNGKLTLYNIKTGKIDGTRPHRYIYWSQAKMFITASDHEDRLQINVQRLNSDEQYSGSIVRQ